MLFALVILGVAVLIAQDRRPRLIVLLMLDQFRADYVDKFQSQWTGGLRRLLAEGAWFRQVDYPYFVTTTCAGHGSVMTGAYPSVHGLILNAWFDRAAGVVKFCSDDEATRLLSYGKTIHDAGHSAVNLRVSTLADELRLQLDPRAKVVVFSHKARSAVALAGQRADAIAWFDVRGGWVTSSAYGSVLVPAVADFVRRHPVTRDVGKTWERTLPRDGYRFEDPATGIKPEGMSTTFPHELRGDRSDPDDSFYLRWLQSPFADEYLADMALDVIREFEVGKTESTDFLGIGFSALDRVGHHFGPHSHETQDALIRLDRMLARLLDSLDAQVGHGNYVVALSSDHGVAPVPERARAFGLDAGRISGRAIEAGVNRAVTVALGPEARVRAVVYTDAYLEPETYARLKDDPRAAATIRAELASVPGILTAYTRDELEAHRFENDPIGQRLARGYDPERSGDLAIVLKPYWIVDEYSANHGSGFGHDTRVPLILMGKAIAPGEYLEPVSPLDIAPTLAFMAGIILPQAQGRVLTEALR